jgi:hypothetical protein
VTPDAATIDAAFDFSAFSSTCPGDIGMVNNNSPLENLAAFALTFVVGVLSNVAMRMYIEKVRRDAVNAAPRAA